MRKVFRSTENPDYWNERWASAGPDRRVFSDLSIYPVRYADEVVTPGRGPVLEAGCGTGRLYFHYRDKGYNIEGIDLSHAAIENILKEEPGAHVVEGDLTNLPYEAGRFEVVLAFGLFHNIEDLDELERAFAETARVMKSGGHIVLSVRCDGIENRLVEGIKWRRDKKRERTHFHKWQFRARDLRQLMAPHGLAIEQLYYARNVSWLFQYDCFRHRTMKRRRFNEAAARSGGFRLNFVGRVLDGLLHGVLPRQFSNIIVCIGRKTVAQ